MKRIIILLGGLLAFFPILGQADGLARWPVVSASELQLWMDSVDPPLILDVRGRAHYHERTIAGAFNGGIDPKGYLSDGGGGRLVLLIQPAADDEIIGAWVTRLVNAGHAVWILQGGLAAWIEVGGATETPESSYTKPGSVPFLIPRGLCEGGVPAHVFE